MTFSTREEYLAAFVAAARPVFAAAGFPIPAAVRVGVGWTSKGSKAKAIGECWSVACSDDGTWEIILSPALADGPRVADVLTHELIHAAVGLECGHKGAFLKAKHALGLDGKATATVAGPVWHDLFDAAVAALGDYPHARLDGAQSSGPKKQGTRMLKAECGCGYAVRLTRKWADVGLPICGVCEVRMTCDAIEGEDDGEAADDAADLDMAANRDANMDVAYKAWAAAKAAAKVAVEAARDAYVAASDADAADASKDADAAIAAAETAYKVWAAVAYAAKAA